MFRRGELDLTRVSGGRPFRKDGYLNRSVDLVMGLRFAQGSRVSQGFAASLDPLELAAVTGGTYTELPAAHTSMTGNGGFGPITIQYTDFHPRNTRHEYQAAVIPAEHFLPSAFSGLQRILAGRCSLTWCTAGDY